MRDRREPGMGLCCVAFERVRAGRRITSLRHLARNPERPLLAWTLQIGQSNPIPELPILFDGAGRAVDSRGSIPKT